MEPKRRWSEAGRQISETRICWQMNVVVGLPREYFLTVATDKDTNLAFDLWAGRMGRAMMGWGRMSVEAGWHHRLNARQDNVEERVKGGSCSGKFTF